MSRPPPLLPPVAAVPTQLVLDFPPRAALGREDFLVAPCNAAAVAWIDRYPQWPAHGLAVFGPPGCGKSHLAHVFASRSGAVPVSLAGLAGSNALDLAASAPAFILEEGEEVAGQDEAERHLFHFFNAVRESGRHLLLTGRMAPARWAIKLPDLRSRLNALPGVEIAFPDDGMMEALLVKLFADRQLRITPDALSYVLPRMERSFAAARALVEAADRQSLTHKRPVSVPLLREILGEG